jgi:hypothetical protein
MGDGCQNARVLEVYMEILDKTFPAWKSVSAARKPALKELRRLNVLSE